MNGRVILIGLGLLFGAVTHGALITYQFNDINAAIPDNNANGYQNSQQITGVQESLITDVDVKLNISGGYNGDLYVYLTHSSGFSVLLNRVGRTADDSFGYGDAGFSVTLNDSALSDIHLYGGNGDAQLTGTWQPDARNVDPAMVLDTSTRSSFLNAFQGLDLNGTWTLFAADVSGGGQSTLVSWELEVTAVPEPVPVALGVFGGLVMMASLSGRIRRKLRARSGPEGESRTL